MPDLRTRVRLPAAPPLLLAVDGDEYTLPAFDTRTWLRVLPQQPAACWWNLIPAQLDESDRLHLVGRLVDPDDDLDIDDLEVHVTDALGQVCGMWFWAAHRLAGELLGHWLRFDGWCVRRGFDPYAAPISRVLAGGYDWLLSHCEKESQVTRLNSDLWAPAPALLPSRRLRDAAPPGWDDDAEAAAFERAQANLKRR